MNEEKDANIYYGSYVSNDDPKSTTLIDSLKHFNPSSSVDSNEDDTDRSLDLNSRSSNHTESSDELLKPDNDFDHSQDCINNIWGGCRKASSMLNTGYHHHHGNNLARQPSLKDKNWVLTMMYGKNPDATEPKSPGFIKAAQHFSPGYWNDALNNENLSAPSATVINDLINLNNPSESVKCLKEKFKQQTNNQNQELNKNINQRVMYPKESISNDFSSNFEFFQWDQLTNQQFLRNLVIDNMDFTDLVDEDDVDICNPTQPLIQNGKNPTINSGKGVIGPPPPPPLMNGNSPTPPPPPLFSFNIGSSSNRQIKNEKILGSGNQSPSLNDSEHSALKQKKTIKLFWKEVKEDKSLLSMIRKKKTIWDDIKPVPIDTKKLEHLFESRTKELMNKGIDRAQDANKKNEIHVLDTKRSNAINICLTKLPKLTAIEQAILKMDHTIMNREDIDKILTTMMPTDEERTKISEAKNQNPNLTLGQAETFLMILSSITALNERLKLWAFSLDYEQTEREIAEKLMDLKQAIYELEKSETFKIVLGTLRSIGNFLNGSEVKGFQIDYLAKVPEIKDTVHKHSLLYHLCQIVMEKNPNTSNLYCELGSVSRASKVDYEELGKSLKKIEQDCKQSCEYLKTISKHDGNNQQAMKMSKFLYESAKKIIVLQIIHRRLMNRLKKLLVFFGLPSSTIKDNKPNQLLKIISEFALEYRTTSERVREQLEKKANHRERNKTRGKLITEMDKFKTTKTKQDQTDLERMLTHSSTFSINSESNTKFDTPPGTKLRRPSTGSMHNLHHLLNNHLKAENDSSYDDNNCKRNGIAQPTRNLNAHRHSVHLQSLIGNEIDVNDEILEGLVRSTLQQPVCNNEKNRRKIRHSQRRSLRRTLKGNLDLTEEERMILGTIKT
ncbi:hypothetical protein QR98_0080220 [Sarcoptes scabiei]|uniref:Uncharacterized protein n=1 Tax=Sarcoptes scabiei TaxID=52283 RepID=A0A132AFX5_SARSC|nr:hypothetical protein QR98_0080220 [Sarcoptes scabiei]